MNTYVLLLYLAELFLEWEMFQTNVLVKIKTHFVFVDSSETRAIYDNVEKIW
jgi:hypothetical protein